MTTVAGLLLAAGAGRRMGRPKGLVEWDGEPLAARAARVLTAGGCTPVIAVLGAEAQRVRTILPENTVPVVAEEWDTGLGASLRAGLIAAADLRPAPDAVLVQLVDLPDVDARVVVRLHALAAPDALARATYGGRPGHPVLLGRPGHPVLLGRRWWPELTEQLAGDRGAGPWLARQPALRQIDCSDLATGRDVDTPDDLRNAPHTRPRAT